VNPNAVVESPSPPKVAVATHFFPQRYLYAFATQAEVLQHIRTQASEAEMERLPEILAGWSELRPRVAQLEERETGLPESATLEPVPQDVQEQIRQIEADPMFLRAFDHLPTSFALVDIDLLIAPQRHVHLDYVDRLTQRVGNSPQMRDLVELCVSTTRPMDPIQHLELAPNAHSFSSPNSDIRFLGAFVKNLGSEDLQYALGGGIPAAAVIAFVGYGSAPINVLKVGSRLILNNGFHRAYALRSLGIRKIPVVVQHVRHVQLECPPAVAGLPREYLLNVPRPVLLKDFFEEGFAITLRVKERIRSVTMMVNVNQHDVPA